MASKDHSELIAALRQRVSGSVVSPADGDYDRLRQPWLEIVDQRPVAIVNAVSVEDISATVRFATEQGLPLGVQNTGHGITRACDGGILLRLAEMKEIVVDVSNRTATIGPGVNSGELLSRTEEHGLVFPSGQVSNVGVIGYTLGGGLGWLSRKLGAACRFVRSATVVLADGSVVQANEGMNPDLFWALRGGGGNFGVVASITVSLFPLPEVFGGMMYFRMKNALSVLESFREWTSDLGVETCATLRLMKLPPKPRFLLHGITETCAITLCHGDVSTARRVRQQLLAFGEPVIDDLKVRSYREMAQYDEASNRDGSATISHVECLLKLSSDFSQKLLQTSTEKMPTIMQFEVQQLGGRFGDDDPALAFQPPQAPFLLHFVSPAMSNSLPELELATRDSINSLGPVFTGESLYNYLRADQQSRVPAVFGPERYARLQQVKRRYDPANVFQLNLNIPPASPRQDL